MKIVSFVFLTTLLVTVFCSSENAFADCDMMAMISMDGESISLLPTLGGDYNDPLDYFLFLKERSNRSTNKINPDGYGVNYYPDDGSFYYNPDNPEDPLNQLWYQTGGNTFYTDNGLGWWDPDWQIALDTAQDVILDDDTLATIVLGHARKGTGADGSHPFRFDYNGKTYTFIHNGWVWNFETNLYDYLLYVDPDWFEHHEPNWVPGVPPPGAGALIDSEVLFHYLMKFIMDYDGNVVAGLYAALNQRDIEGADVRELVRNPEPNGYGSYRNVINFILSDGDMIYCFRNAPDDDEDHELFLNQMDDFVAINTWFEPAPNTVLAPLDLAIVDKVTGAQVISEFLDSEPIDIVQVLDVSGSMSGYASPAQQDTKIDVLISAVEHFIELMVPNIENQLGLVKFNQDEVAFPPDSEATLAELTTARVPVLLNQAVPTLSAGGTTSIGDGLNGSLTQFMGAGIEGHRRSVLLITDGKENRPAWIADVVDDLVDANVAVYPLGLGYNTGIDEDILIDLADTTGGDYRITCDNLEFRRFFMEILISNFDWSVLDDGEGMLANGNNANIPVYLSVDDRFVTFNAFWEGGDNIVSMDLLTPDGVLVDPTASEHIRYVEESRYAFYQIDYRMAGIDPNDWAGTWNVRLTHDGSLDPANYVTAFYTNSLTQLDVEFDTQYHLTNEELVVQAYLHKGKDPVLNANVNVVADIPLIGMGNLLHDYFINVASLDPDLKLKSDPISLLEQKIQIVSPYLKRTTTTFTLYDDGKHKDKSANDGIYGNTFKSTKIQGTYNFRVTASGSSTASAQPIVNRKWTATTYHEVDIDPDYSDIIVKPVLKKEGTLFNISLTPRDITGNYMGPGYSVCAEIMTPKAVRSVSFKDPNLIGAYESSFLITNEEFNSGVKVKITVNDRIFIDDLLKLSL